MEKIKKYLLPGAIALALIIISIVVIFLVKKNKPIEQFRINPEFAEYISAVTTGVISCESTIKVVMVSPFQGDSAKREELIKDIFSFSPDIKGTAHWSDDRTVEFAPSEKLESGTFYKAEFKINKLANVPDNLKILKFTFVIIRQDFSITDDGLHTYAGSDEKYFLKGTIKTSDVTDNEACEKMISAKIGTSSYGIRWEHASNRLSHFYTIDSINRTSENQILNILCDGKTINVDNSKSIEVEIPAIGDFKVIDARQITGNENYVKVIFSDPIDPGQDLSGLIRINNAENLRFTIEDNIVKTFYSNSNNAESLQIDITSGILNLKGTRLPNGFKKELQLESIKPAVELIGKGVIMPNSGIITLPFRAVNLKAVDVTIIKIFENNIPQFLQINSLDGVRELKRVGRPVYKGKIDLITDHNVDFSLWNTFSIDLSKFIKTDPGSLYRVTISFRKAYSLYPCETDSASKNDNELAIQESEELDNSKYDVENNNEYYDDYSYYYENGVYEEENYWQNRENPCSKAYYSSERMPSCNVLASNFGITAKVNKNNEVHVIVADINSAKPLSGIKIDILDYQQQVMASSSTNFDGIAIIKTDHRPYLVIAKDSKERGYLPLTSGSTLSLSTFDIGGNEVQKGIKGFIYGERGVWRPGDTLFLTFILEDKNKTLPPAHPVIFELSDPKGKLFKKLVRTNSTNGFFTFIVPTDEKSPTGDWNLKVKAGGAEFNKTLKIETVKPNRLEIKLELNEGKEFVESNLSGKLIAHWLHGAPASNLKARMSVTLSSSTTSFKKFPDYCFDDMTRTCNSEEKVIFEGQLDENGNTSLSGTIDPGQEVPGILRAGFITKVFEESGDFSIDYVSMPFSPYKNYVGVKTPKSDNWGGLLYTDTDHEISVATVDQSGNPESRRGIEVSVYKIQWRWWWDASDNDMASYFANTSQTPVFSTTISTSQGIGSFKFRVASPEWGRYLIHIKEPSGHACSKIVYVDWPGWSSRTGSDNPGGASVISIAPDKNSYKVGEKAKITIPSSGKGRALVSIESGSQIIDMFWVEMEKSTENRMTIDIPIKPEMAPNVFINVTILQPRSSTENDAPLRMYGYAPILVEDPETHLEPEIALPDAVGSEELFNIEVKEKSGKPMTYTIAVVDEGLLGLTRFKTPDPHATFYAREALGIKTWDMYDLVFGAFGGEIEQVFGIGGDQDLASMKSKKNAERFKPVVKFLGPFTLGKGSKNVHSVKLPKYNGAVRAMLVAGQDGAYGFTEKTVKVKNALMIVATLPRVLGPTETVTMPVTVFSDEASVKNVQLKVQSNALLISQDGLSKSVKFDKPGSEIVNFTFKVAKSLGVAEVKVIANSGKYKADYSVELNVRNPNPPLSLYSGTIIEAGKEWNQTLEMVGMPGTNKAIVEISSLPPLDLGRRLNYLIQYPHGCIEQTTSGVFPQLYLNDLMDISTDRQKVIEENLKAGIARIRTFQTSDGGLSYWPGENSSNEWASNYGGHFMIEAEKLGYKLPAGFKESWLRYQQTKARNSNGENTYYYYNDFGLTQSYRLYTLALAGKPEMGAMNRMRERAGNSVQTKWMLASAYLKAGQEEIARELINNLGTEIKPYIEMGYTYGSDLRDKAIILETYSLLKDFKLGATLAESIAKEISSDGWYSTHTLGYCLISIAQFAKASGMTKGGVSFTYNIDKSGAKKIDSRSTIYQFEPDVKNKSSIQLNLTNQNKGTLYARFYLSGVPVAGEEQNASSNMSLNIEYRDMKGNVLNVSQLTQGTDFKAIVTIRNTSTTEYYQNLALTQVVPSGWEIINSRVGDIQAGGNSVLPDYQDIRDDRILSYFNLSHGEAKTFTFSFNASYLGEFYMPAISCEAMYNNKIYARKAGGWIKVKN